MQQVMSSDAIERTLVRITHEMIERYHEGLKKALIVGIRTRGVPLADRIAAMLQESLGWCIPRGVLDITLYRDDLTQIGPAPLVRRTEIPPASIEGRTIFLVDDVLYTGRTVRAAMDALIDFGRPKAIRFIVLIDRGQHELPVQADISGRFIPVRKDELIHVMLKESDGKDEVIVLPRPSEPEGR